MHLYELAEESLALDALVSMDLGEWTADHEALETELVAKLVQKADAFGGYLANLQATVDACKTDELRLAARRKAAESAQERLKRYALMALQAMQRDKVTGERFTLAIQLNNPKLELDATISPETLEERFVRVIPESREIDRAAILAALKAGETVNGCAAVRLPSLRIR